MHVISPEQGIVLPGLSLVCPDSHTCTQGRWRACLGHRIDRSRTCAGDRYAASAQAEDDADHRPRAARHRRDGEGPRAAHRLAVRIGRGERHRLEYAGEAVRALDVEGRLTLCNMATELAAFSAIIAPDDVVFAYLQGRSYAPDAAAWDGAVAFWRTLNSDEDAVFDADHVVDAADVPLMVSWGTSPQQALALGDPVPAFDAVACGTQAGHDRALSYMGLQPGDRLETLPIDAAFIGSCTNARISDLRRAAEILRGRKVAAGVKAICVPGSTAVKAAAEAEGLDRVFRDAGFEWREAGCSMCFFAGGESFGFRQRVITSTNRNFEEPAGAGDAIAPRFAGDGGGLGHRRAYRRSAGPGGMSAAPFRSLAAVALPLVRDNIDTDAIIPSREMKSVSKKGVGGRAVRQVALYRDRRARARAAFRAQPACTCRGADPHRRREFRVRIEPRTCRLGAGGDMASAQWSRRASTRSFAAIACATASCRSNCRGCGARDPPIWSRQAMAANRSRSIWRPCGCRWRIVTGPSGSTTRRGGCCWSASTRST